VAFSVAGLRLAAGNFNIVTDGDRKRTRYASRDGDRNTAGDLLFNYCVEMECGVVRTADFEFKGLVKCRDFGTAFSQWSLVVNAVVVEMGQRRRLGQAQAKAVVRRLVWRKRLKVTCRQLMSRHLEPESTDYKIRQ
jgi:hypothetical protein